MSDSAFDVTDPYEVAQAHGARVGEHEAAHDVVDQAARAERDYQPQKNADTFERVGLAAGHVRVGDYDCEQPQESCDQPARRLSRLGVDPARLDSTSFDCVEPEPDQPDQETGQHKDQGNHEQAWNRIGDTEAEIFDGGHEEPTHRLAPGPRIREAPQDARHS